MDAEFLQPSELPNLAIETLGEATRDSPLLSGGRRFIDDDEKILVYSHSEYHNVIQTSAENPPMLERAGPRRKIYFDPTQLNCGIVTCGGLCPGLNDVIRTITLSLIWQYGVRNVFGFRYGYAGLSANPPKPPLVLTSDLVDGIHLRGGDILSSSRGPQDIDEMVHTLQEMKINLLFVLGGDGTLRGANELVKNIKKRNLPISIIGIPKTIDNDITGIEQSFGFSTAVEATRAAIHSAHAEAKGAWNGVGLVKLMGRDSGFIAAYGTLANSDVNFCFIPEAPLVLEGENGFLDALEKRLERKHHAVVVIAEGAGWRLSRNHSTQQTDASGNVVREDIGLFLKQKITEHFRKKSIPLSLKYIDPSYMIRSLPADSNDSAFCVMLGQNAVHAGLSGRTNMVVGYWNQHFVHIPISLTIRKRKKVDPQGHLWQTVLDTTGQSC
ncbi:MAG: ATP-dependent 6-phosphofructokinase [Sedimentisphaerales bacterium]|nr:ATP-dependent 6-phosphofructokinase [Sedimentisphaerales bacterium]